LGTGAIPIVLTFLLVLVAWRVVFSFNKDLVRARAWGELGRRSLPFVAITLMALSLPPLQGLAQGSGSLPLIWAVGFGVVLVASNFLSTPLLERRANTAFRRGDYEAAASLYGRLTEERPLARHYAFLGAALGAKGDHEGAVRAADRAVELDGEYGLAYYNRALVQRRMGRKTKARRDLERALAADLPRRFRKAAEGALQELKEKR
jgi:tetratricopeptide (TPR) repeat protein